MGRIGEIARRVRRPNRATGDSHPDQSPDHLRGHLPGRIPAQRQDGTTSLDHAPSPRRPRNEPRSQAHPDPLPSPAEPAPGQAVGTGAPAAARTDEAGWQAVEPAVEPAVGRADGSAHDEPLPRRQLVFAIVAMALFMASVDQTIVATALTSIQHDLHARVNWSAW